MTDDNTTMIKPTKKHAQPIYTTGEEIFNSVTHIVGAVFGIIALIIGCVIISKNPAGYKYTAIIIYSVSMIILYTMSALYHAIPQGKAKRVLRIFDHCTIFLLIAGTYTPYCLIAFNGLPIGLTLFYIEWGLALVGITFNAINMNWKAVKVLSLISYIIMGWCIVFTFKTLSGLISLPSLIYLIVGGLFYTGGIIFYKLKSVKYFHSIWHLFVLAGTVFQFFSIMLIL